MKYFIIAVGVIIVAVGAAFGITFVTEGIDVANSRFFSPLHEEIRRQTFEQSRAYREGIAHELQNMQFEYVRATPEQKAALSSVILHRTAGIEMDWLPQDLQQFIVRLRAERGINAE
jgi:hypothetical protein